MAPKRRKSTANRKPKGRKTKAQTRYVVSAVFRMKRTVSSKTEADKWVAKAKRNGGVASIKKM